MLIYLRKIFNKSFIKNNKILLNFALIIYFYSGYFSYLYSILLNKPYIGSYYFSNLDSGRNRLNIINSVINSVIKKIKKKEINILELGVYCGQNTINLKKKLSNYNVNHYAVDIFDSFKMSSDDKGYNNFFSKKTNSLLRNRNIHKLFLHNIRSTKFNEKYKIFTKKMTTKKFFKTNKRMYDLIIIDANHQFKYVYSDIIYSIKFLNKGGIIIGDDYELNAKDISFNSLKKIKNIDYTEFNNKNFHPGVTLSVKYVFNNLQNNNGLFCVKKNDKNFIDFFSKKIININKKY